MTTDLKRLADIVRERRTARGLTQRELAERVGVHEQTIGNLERGNRATDPATLAKVGKVLGVDLTSPTAVAGAQVLAQSVEAIRTELARRAESMDTAQQLVFFGEVMTFVTSWTPSRR